jgi:hypothetical protein
LHLPHRAAEKNIVRNVVDRVVAIINITDITSRAQIDPHRDQVDSIAPTTKTLEISNRATNLQLILAKVKNELTQRAQTRHNSAVMKFNETLAMIVAIIMTDAEHHSDTITRILSV